jgi:hypothetical protein
METLAARRTILPPPLPLSVALTASAYAAWARVTTFALSSRKKLDRALQSLKPEPVPACEAELPSGLDWATEATLALRPTEELGALAPRLRASGVASRRDTALTAVENRRAG